MNPPPLKPPSAERYPALKLYLRAARFVVVLSSCGVLSSLLLLAVAAKSDANGLLSMQSLVVLVASAFWYVVCMAGIELVQVVLDIEKNTRK
jgi:hypothetical protein